MTLALEYTFSLINEIVKIGTIDVTDIVHVFTIIVVE